MDSADELARLGKILSAATRVRILRALKAGPLCVGALSNRLDITQGAVSQHLRVMRDAGLLVAERRGYFIHYRLDLKRLTACRSGLTRLLTAKTRSTPKRRAKCARQGEKRCARKKPHARKKPSARSRNT